MNKRNQFDSETGVLVCTSAAAALAVPIMGTFLPLIAWVGGLLSLRLAGKQIHSRNKSRRARRR